MRSFDFGPRKAVSACRRKGSGEVRASTPFRKSSIGVLSPRLGFRQSPSSLPTVGFFVVCQSLAPNLLSPVWARNGVIEIGSMMGKHRKLFVARMFESSNPGASFAGSQRPKGRLTSARSHQCVKKMVIPPNMLGLLPNTRRENDIDRGVGCREIGFHAIQRAATSIFAQTAR